MILGCLRMTQSRYQHFDYPHPWCTTSFNLMIPIPGVSSNISAVWRSFEISVFQPQHFVEPLNLNRNTGTGLGGYFYLHDHHDAVLILRKSIRAIR
jgi:hypothetical protein